MSKDTDKTKTNADAKLTFNRLATVGIGSFVWVVVLTIILQVPLFWSIIMMLWISMGSTQLVKNIGGFEKSLGPKQLLFAGMISPAWPWLK